MGNFEVTTFIGFLADPNTFEDTKSRVPKLKDALYVTRNSDCMIFLELRASSDQQGSDWGRVKV